MTSKLIRDKLYARLPKVLVELILDFASQWKEQWQEVSKGLNMLCPEYATFEEHHTIMYDFKRDYHISRTAFVMLERAKPKGKKRYHSRFLLTKD
jgi:hypothetical protein